MDLAMRAVSKADLVARYERANLQGWIPYFRSASDKYGIQAEYLLAAASMYSRLRTIYLKRPGPRNARYGMFQVPGKLHPEFALSSKWRDPEECVYHAASTILEYYNTLAANRGRDFTLILDNRIITFRCPDLAEEVNLISLAIKCLHEGYRALYDHYGHQELVKSCGGVWNPYPALASIRSELSYQSAVFKELLDGNAV